MREVEDLTRGKSGDTDSDNPDAKLLGTFLEKPMEILVEKNQKEPIKKITAIHEVLHGMLAYTSFRNTAHEEDVCICLEQSIYNFIRNNPEFVKYIQEK